MDRRVVELEVEGLLLRTPFATLLEALASLADFGATQQVVECAVAGNEPLEQRSSKLVLKFSQIDPFELKLQRSSGAGYSLCSSLTDEDWHAATCGARIPLKEWHASMEDISVTLDY